MVGAQPQRPVRSSARKGTARQPGETLVFMRFPMRGPVRPLHEVSATCYRARVHVLAAALLVFVALAWRFLDGLVPADGGA